MQCCCLDAGLTHCTAQQPPRRAASWPSINSTCDANIGARRRSTTCAGQGTRPSLSMRLEEARAAQTRCFDSWLSSGTRKYACKDYVEPAHSPCVCDCRTSAQPAGARASEADGVLRVPSPPPHRAGRRGLGLGSGAGSRLGFMGSTASALGRARASCAMHSVSSCLSSWGQRSGSGRRWPPATCGSHVGCQH